MGIRLKNINRIARQGRVGFRTVVSGPPIIDPPVIGGPLTWITPPGTLGTFDEGAGVSIQVEVADPNDNVSNWSISAGSLPTGLEINPFSGIISGTAEAVPGSDQTATFTIRVTDEDGNVLTGIFSITIRDLPSIEWVTPAGTVGETTDWADFEMQLEARPV